MTQADKPAPIALRIADAARAIGVSRSKLYNMVNDGQLKIVKIGGVSVIARQELEDLIRSA